MQRLYERAENETRTRDPNLGKVVLYQLSYFRLLNSAAKIHFFLIYPSLSKKNFLSLSIGNFLYLWRLKFLDNNL